MSTISTATVPNIPGLPDSLQDKVWVSNREKNMYDDSTFFATYWIEGTTEFNEVQIGATWYGGGVYSVPVTKDQAIIALYSAWLDREAAKAEALIPRTGKKCTLRNSRKYKGIGTIRYIAQSRYDSRVLVAGVYFENGLTEASLDRVQLVSM